MLWMKKTQTQLLCCYPMRSSRYCCLSWLQIPGSSRYFLQVFYLWVRVWIAHCCTSWAVYVDQDKFLEKLTAVAILGTCTNGRGTVMESGPVIGSLRPRPGPCADCGLVTERPPTRVYSYKGRRRTGRCLECKMVQNEPDGAFDSWYVYTKPKA